MKIRKTYLYILLLVVNLVVILCLLPVSQTSSYEKRPVLTTTFHITGEVNFPGIYVVEGEITVADAIRLAGGLKLISNIQSLNLAELVGNYQLISISANKSTNPTGESSSLARRVNVNLASLADLDELPGIGPALAARITESRPYKDIADLEKVSGISQTVIENIRSLIEF